MAQYVVNRRNFLASEDGLITKTVGLDAVTNSALVSQETDENGYVHKVVKAGTIYVSRATASPYAVKIAGLVYQDVDVTNTTATTQKEAPIMVAGYFFNDTDHIPAALGTTAATSATSPLTIAEAQAQGLYPVDVAYGDATVTRPY